MLSGILRGCRPSMVQREFMKRVSKWERKSLTVIGAKQGVVAGAKRLKRVPAFLALYKFFLNLPFPRSIRCMLDCHLSRVR
jgi:hypothetical protein